MCDLQCVVLQRTPGLEWCTWPWGPRKRKRRPSTSWRLAAWCHFIATLCADHREWWNWSSQCSLIAPIQQKPRDAGASLLEPSRLCVTLENCYSLYIEHRKRPLHARLYFLPLFWSWLLQLHPRLAGDWNVSLSRVHHPQCTQSWGGTRFIRSLLLQKGTEKNDHSCPF